MKGQLIALEAMERLARANRAFHMALVGRGALDLAIRAAQARAGLAERVSILEGGDRIP